MIEISFNHIIMPLEIPFIIWSLSYLLLVAGRYPRWYLASPTNRLQLCRSLASRSTSFNLLSSLCTWSTQRFSGLSTRLSNRNWFVLLILIYSFSPQKKFELVPYLYLKKLFLFNCFSYIVIVYKKLVLVCFKHLYSCSFK